MKLPRTITQLYQENPFIVEAVVAATSALVFEKNCPVSVARYVHDNPHNLPYTDTVKYRVGHILENTPPLPDIATEQPVPAAPSKPYTYIPQDAWKPPHGQTPIDLPPPSMPLVNLSDNHPAVQPKVDLTPVEKANLPLRNISPVLSQNLDTDTWKVSHITFDGEGKTTVVYEAKDDNGKVFGIIKHQKETQDGTGEKELVEWDAFPLNVFPYQKADSLIEAQIKAVSHASLHLAHDSLMR